MTARPQAPGAAPPLEAGDTLARDEFHRRYVLHPEISKAELIDGVVYVPSPVSVQHSAPHGLVVTWLGVYASSHPRCELHDNVTLRLSGENEVQPDALLRLADSGSSHAGADGYIYGAMLAGRLSEVVGALKRPPSSP